MFFTINYIPDIPKIVLKSNLYRGSRLRILSYPFKANEVLLNQYLITNFKLPLRLACLNIINNCKVLESNDHFVINIPDKKLNKLAQLITYGNNEIQGSKILIKSFNYR